MVPIGGACHRSWTLSFCGDRHRPWTLSTSGGQFDEGDRHWIDFCTFIAVFCTFFKGFCTFRHYLEILTPKSKCPTQVKGVTLRC
jgi:hypothetical protein